MKLLCYVQINLDIDGAFFGTTFASLFFISFEELVPSGIKEAYIPKAFGFKIHSSSKCNQVINSTNSINTQNLIHENNNDQDSINDDQQIRKSQKLSETIAINNISNSDVNNKTVHKKFTNYNQVSSDDNSQKIVEVLGKKRVNPSL